MRAAVHELEGAGRDAADETLRAWAWVMVLLHREYRAGYAWGLASGVARELVDAMPESGWPFEMISLEEQGNMILDTLALMGDLERAKRLAVRLGQQMSGGQGDLDQDSLRNVSVALNKVGDVELSGGDAAGALQRYEESLTLRRRLLQEFGATPQSLRDVMVSCFKIADVKVATDPGKACVAAEEAVTLCEEIITRWGETPGRRAEIEAVRNLRDQVCGGTKS